MKKIILMIFCTVPIFGVFGDDSSTNKVIVKETAKMIRVINGDMTVEFGLSKKNIKKNKKKNKKKAKSGKAQALTLKIKPFEFRTGQLKQNKKVELWQYPTDPHLKASTGYFTEYNWSYDGRFVATGAGVIDLHKNSLIEHPGGRAYFLHDENTAIFLSESTLGMFDMENPDKGITVITNSASGHLTSVDFKNQYIMTWGDEEKTGTYRIELKAGVQPENINITGTKPVPNPFYPVINIKETKSMQTGVLGSGGLSVSLDGKQQNWMNPGGMRHHSGWLGNGEYFINGDGLIRGRKWDEPYKNVDTGEFGDLHILSIAHMGDFSRMGTSGRWAVGGGNGGGSTISIGDLRSGDGYKFLHPLSVIAVPEGLSGDKSGYYDAEPKGSPDGTKFSFTTSADLINGTHTFATKTQTETTTNTISVESTEGFPAKGYLLWGNKDGAVAHYTSITATSFEGVTLAVDGTKNNRVSKGKWLAPLDERLIPEDEHTATGKDALVKLFPDSMLQRQRKMGLWFAVHRSPDRPWLRINGATLELIPGENHSETKGYIIYRNGKALSDQPVTSVKLTMPGKYQAVAVEWSGLKSELSKAVDVIEGITKLSILKERPTDFSWTNTQWIVGGKAVNESQAMKADGSERQTIHLVDGIIAKTSYQSGKKVFHQDLNADKKPIRQLFYKEGKLTRRDHKNADGKLVSREVFDQDERVSHQIIFEHHHHVFDEVQEHWIFNKGEMMALYTLNGHSRSGKKSGTYKNQHGSEWTKVSSENTLGYDYKKFN